MSISAINEQLLRAIGVGIAIVGEEDLGFRFHNEKFAEWFGEPDASLPDVFSELSIDQLRDGLAADGSYSIECRVKPKRRMLIIALSLSRATSNGESLLVVECQNITRIRELESMIDSYSTMVERNTREIERERERAERLLLNIMPKTVYEEFKTFGVVNPHLYEEVTVVMLDFIGFTKLVTQVDPNTIVSELNDIFTSFDRISEQFGCERIKTMGDAYLAVAGMPEPNPDHARAVANCAIRFVRYLERRNMSSSIHWNARVGIATGSVVGSVVGVQKYVYDIFGEAVNLASRLQVFADPMQIIAHNEMKKSLVEEFTLSDLGRHEVRGFGEMRLIDLSTELKGTNTRHRDRMDPRN
ncbi:MAG: adenylate/guanylate cyclase domain-containing protein [Paracoccaceae bacterium]|nr:adenylate/guanylate cyclase domain-containing protein [Paracoccaceae bacterium]